jgi:hypothetical protein
MGVKIQKALGILEKIIVFFPLVVPGEIFFGV